MENKELLELLDANFMSTSEAIEALAVSKQCFHSLVTRNKLTKIKKGSCVLYFRYQIEDRKKHQEELRNKYRPYGT
ncbi:DNA-binding protein [Listeria booriae]|uniref:DNA-binding protein n=1 Tax=Listeria booriae TaxID=1552123 RepID=UPI00162A286E|nr:DNA-binding protein [Listeria booriae]MBC2149682.1 helix-turn-helix domain-containing protein [Listeria booriae]MBC6301621.1 helix-turn-helix domain-containing protein [Listeria booriae]